MLNARRAVGLTAIVAGGALLVAPGAHARTLNVQVALPGSNGYKLSIGAARGTGIGFGVSARPLAGAPVPEPLRALARRQAAAGIRAAKRSAAGSAAGRLAVHVRTARAASSYSVPATVTRSRLRANLGAFGSVILRFHARRTNTHHTDCARVRERIGTFTGRVRFRGEKDYVDIEAARARGRVRVTSVRLPCPKAVAPAGRATREAVRLPPDHRSPSTGLHAKSDDAAFVALKVAQKFSGFVASVVEPAGRVLVARIGVGSGKASEFKVNRRLTSARIRPSATTFQGSAAFAAPRAWRGSLTASFPGAPDVPFAGQGFRARLLRLP